MTEWTEAFIQTTYIDAGQEENTSIEYKAALSLEKTTGKKKEIAKDVSAMANAAGGIIFYGIKEFNEDDKKHLPERFDPIDRTSISREWLEQVISTNIRPKIEGLTITPVELSSGTAHAVYVVEIPQSSTAHQVTTDKDHRYYRRLDTTNLSMEDYEIRDVMNRAVAPDAEVEFGYKLTQHENGTHKYTLQIKVRNVGTKVIDAFKLKFSFPNYGRYIAYNDASPNYQSYGVVHSSKEINDDYVIMFLSSKKLFPEDEIDIGRELSFTYHVNDEVYSKFLIFRQQGEELALHWVLFADNMLPKRGTIPIEKLHSF